MRGRKGAGEIGGNIREREGGRKGGERDEREERRGKGRSGGGKK